MHDVHLPRSAYYFLALLTAIIGLSSSAVTAEFFVLGLTRMEPDTLARQALIAAGVLMIVTELAAFGLAALLPRQMLRGLRSQLMLCGVLLLAFEGATIYVTQITLVQSASVAATSSSTRIDALRASIDSQRAAIAGMRASGAAQSASSNAWTQHMGAQTLKQAIDADRQITPLTDELAQLQAAVQPTLQDALGEQGLLIYTVARALLISVMGLVMFSAAGALLRAARSAITPVPLDHQPSQAPQFMSAPTVFASTQVPAEAQSSSTATATVSTAPSTVSTVASTVTPAWSTRPHSTSTEPITRYASTPARRLMTLPIAALAAAPLAFAAPAPAQQVPAKTQTSADQSTAIAQRQTTLFFAEPESSRKPAARKARATESTDTEARYQRVLGAVLTGKTAPTVRAIQALESVGTLAARRLLDRLAANGATERAGQGWRVAGDKML